MAAKNGENQNFSPLHRTLLYYPVGQKFARNHSISYSFQDIHTFSFSRKDPRWPPKVAKIEIFALCTGHSCTTLWVKNSHEIALTHLAMEIHLQTTDHVVAVEKVAEQHIGTTYCKCNSFRVIK